MEAYKDLIEYLTSKLDGVPECVIMEIAGHCAALAHLMLYDELRRIQKSERRVKKERSEI